jgi:hypothetical protein
MDRKELLEKAKMLGYPLLEIEETLEVNLILAEIVKSEDLRLWEGFPIMLANSLDKSLFDFDRAYQQLEDPKAHEDFQNLVLLSLALFSYLEIEFSFLDRIYESDYFDEARFEEYLKGFKQKKDFTNLSKGLSSVRLVSTFKNYYRRTELDLKDFTEMQDEFELEFSMSQIFSKKQKDLFLKKLKREKLTKTEREYYSRSVRKKVQALANSDLNKLAVRLIRE